jgi:hypothetical protein
MFNSKINAGIWPCSKRKLLILCGIIPLLITEKGVGTASGNNID